jgi:hypothetical protein
VTSRTAPPASTQIAQFDAAETFAESDVSLGLSTAEVASESVRLSGRSVSRSSDDSTGSVTGKSGVAINPNESLSAIEVRASGNTSGATEAYVTDTSLNLLGDSPVALSGGTAVVGNLSLSSGTKYYVVVDDGGNSYTQGYEGNTGFPYSGGPLDIVAGVDEGTEVTTKEPGVNPVVVPEPSGSVTVEWSNPPDVYAWDRVGFQATEDGETVDVFVEESADGGESWTEIAGPVQPGDAIPADPANEVRFRVDLSRAALSNNPTLDAIYRRWVVSDV